MEFQKNNLLNLIKIILQYTAQVLTKFYIIFFILNKYSKILE